MNDSILIRLYGCRAGRWLLRAAMRLGLFRLMAAYLRSGLSRWRIPHYIRRHGISLVGFPRESYPSFAAFFTRQKLSCTVDMYYRHFISPCDAYLSTYSIGEDSSFLIKGLRYTTEELLCSSVASDTYCEGLCLVFRLSAADCHHYIVTDDGYICGSNVIEGLLHSVQPVALRALPVYNLNRRVWNRLDTDHFGPIIQVEVGAMAVGGIVNRSENCSVRRGDEMGHFELCGSTIVMLVQKDRVELLPEIFALTDSEQELRVTQGCCIGVQKSPHRNSVIMCSQGAPAPVSKEAAEL